MSLRPCPALSLSPPSLSAASGSCHAPRATWRDIKPHTHTNQGSCPPWLRPLLMSWTGLWHAVIGLWAFLSLRRLLWLQGLAELYGLCTRGILNISVLPSYRLELLNECTLKLSSTPSVVRTVWFIPCTDSTQLFLVGWTPSPNPLWNPTVSRKSGTPQPPPLSRIGCWNESNIPLIFAISLLEAFHSRKTFSWSEHPQLMSLSSPSSVSFVALIQCWSTRSFRSTIELKKLYFCEIFWYCFFEWYGDKRYAFCYKTYKNIIFGAFLQNHLRLT
mgnify:CR=1 FL=1